MSIFYKREREGDKIKLECGFGDITEAIKEAIQICRIEPDGPQAEFKFNGVTVVVRRNSGPDLIRRDWERALKKYIPSPVGPFPKWILSPEEIASDAAIEAESERKRQERAKVYEAEAKAKSDALAARLAIAPEFESADGWAEHKEINSHDGYSAATIRYAENWARLMQLDMASGKTLEEIADITSREADDEGITGAMYGFAVGSLAMGWRHGEQLRIWHNLKTQIRDEGEKANETGGVLNPAMLCIGA